MMCYCWDETSNILKPTHWNGLCCVQQICNFIMYGISIVKGIVIKSSSKGFPAGRSCDTHKKRKRSSLCYPNVSPIDFASHIKFVNYLLNWEKHCNAFTISTDKLNVKNEFPTNGRDIFIKVAHDRFWCSKSI